MKKNYTTFLFIFSIITVILAVCLFIFFLKVIKNKNQHTSAVMTTLGTKAKEKENALIFAEKVAEIKSTQDTINSRFVDPNKIDIFVGYLEKIGSIFGSEVSVVSIEIPPKTKNTIAVRLSATGTFNEVMNTITYLEDIPYQITFTQLNLNKSEQQGSKTTDLVTIPSVVDWSADVSFNILSLN